MNRQGFRAPASLWRRGSAGAGEMGRARQPIDVAACIVRRPDGRVLMAERTARQISPFHWEAPGGKIDPGETAVEAAKRELLEEVGLEATSARPWTSYEHAFPTRRIRLQFFLIETWRGEARGREGQRIAWIDPGAPHVAPILSSNARALAALCLPSGLRRLVCSEFCGPNELLAALPGLLSERSALIVLDAPHMTSDQKVALARRAGEIARAFGAPILLSGSAHDARRAGLSAIHSSALDLQRLGARPPTALWAVSCGDASDLALAARLGADIAILPESQAPSLNDQVRLGAPRLYLASETTGAEAYAADLAGAPATVARAA
jgi:8-oxo-dGTP diphosphatase